MCVLSKVSSPVIYVLVVDRPRKVYYSGRQGYRRSKSVLFECKKQQSSIRYASIQIMFHFSRTHFVELVDRVCIARILETESQLRSCHKTVPFKLFSKNLGVSMCTQMYTCILYIYNILLEHNTVERKQALYFYTRIKQETFV